jgi:hypothetical protein
MMVMEGVFPRAFSALPNCGMKKKVRTISRKGIFPGNWGKTHPLAGIFVIPLFIVCMAGESEVPSRFPSQDGGIHLLRGMIHGREVGITDSADHISFFHPRPEGAVAGIAPVTVPYVIVTQGC